MHTAFKQTENMYVHVHIAFMVKLEHSYLSYAGLD